jgi:hypothetical protein
MPAGACGPSPGRATFRLIVFRRIVFTAALLWIGLGATAAADVYDDNPATASRGPGEVYVFARAADGSILERHADPNGWTDWVSLGGSATSGPAAINYGGNILVFVRGPDGGIYQKTLDASNQWTSGWAALGGFAASAPGATWRRGSSNVIDLVVKGGDNALWHRAFVPGQGWTQPATIGGNLTSAPAVNSQSAELLNIWARGTDGAVYQRSWNGSAWVDWFSVGGGIEGAPASVSRAENVIDIYVRGANRATYQMYWTPSGYSPWFLLDQTPIDSSPAAAGDGPDHEWIVARGGGGLLFKEWTAAKGWTAWSDLGPVAVPPPAPAPSAPVPDGSVNLETGVRCTPPGGKVRVSVAVRRTGGKKRARVTRIVFYTKGQGRKVRTDRKAPFVVRIPINRAAGETGRVYARVYYKRSAHGKLHRKVVSRRYAVCR